MGKGNTQSFRVKRIKNMKYPLVWDLHLLRTGTPLNDSAILLFMCPHGSNNDTGKHCFSDKEYSFVNRWWTDQMITLSFSSGVVIEEFPTLREKQYPKKSSLMR